MKITFLYFLIFFFQMEAHAQAWQWEKMFKPYDYNMGSFERASILSNLAIDKSGNTYVLIADSCVFFDGKTPIGFGEPALVKISPQGHLIWSALIHFSNSQSLLTSIEIKGGMLNNWGVISIAQNGHIMVSGHLPGTLGFGSIILLSIGSLYGFQSAITNLFLAECDTSGLWVQAHSLGATVSGSTYLTGMAIDKNSNVFINGTSFGKLIISDTNSHVWLNDSIYSSPAMVFLGSFKMDGSVNWVDNFPNRYGTEIQNRYDFDMDANGNMYFAASCTAQSNYDTVFIYKIKAQGNLASVKVIPDMYGGSANITYTVKTDKSSNVYLAASLTGTIDFGNGFVLKENNQKGFLVKYDSNFVTQWVQGLNSNGSSAFDNICLDTIGNIYTIGNFSGQLHLGDSVYTGSAFIAEYASNGNVITGAITAGYGDNIALDSSGDLITDGGFSNTIHFGCDSLIGGTGYGYIAKFNPHPPIIKVIPFCSGDSLICTDTSLYSNLIWKFRDGSTLMGNKIVYKSNTKGYYHFTLYATNSVGCQVFVSDSFRHPAPPVAAFTTKDSVACEYTKVILNDISKTDTIAPGIWPQDNWDFGDGTSSQTKKTTTKIYQDTGSFTIKLSYNNGFCTTDTSMKINVVPAPKPGFSVSDTMGCQPLSIHVTDQSQGNVIGWQYVVQRIFPLPFSRVDSLRTPSFQHDFLLSGLYKIHQYLTGPSGCVTVDSATITVNPTPSVKFQRTDSVCLGTEIGFGFPNISGYIYSWTSVPPGFISNTSKPIDVPKASTTYNLKEMISATGCSDSGKVLYCFVEQRPIASFAYQHTRGFDYSFAIKRSKNINYSFDFGDSQQVSLNKTDTVVSHTFPGNGKYVVTLSALSDTGLKCESFMTDTIIINEPFSLNIFPNPFYLQTEIQYTLVNPGHVKISLTDEIGRQVGTLMDAQQNRGEYDLKYDGAARETKPAMYYVVFQLDDKVIVKKIIQLGSIYY